MTREEEIKAHLYEYPVPAAIDLRYLLARNEELQRRVEKMQAVVDAAKRACRGSWKRSEENFSRVNYKDLEALQDALDAKEQDDAEI